MDNNIETYGISEHNQVNSDIDIAVEEILIDGFTIIPNVLSDSETTSFRTALDKVYDRQCEEIGGAALLEEINDAFIVRSPLAYDEAFLDLARHPIVMQVANALLGSNFILMMQNGIINSPSSPQYQTRWHRDLNYQHWVASRPLAFHALFCLDPFNEKTGGTCVLPGTHMHEKFPSEQYVLKHQRVAEAPAGSLIMANAMMYHRAGRNTSPSVRRGVNHVIGMPFMAQQVDLPNMLGKRYKDDPVLGPYLGYRWNPKSSVRDWRKERLK